MQETIFFLIDYYWLQDIENLLKQIQNLDHAKVKSKIRSQKQIT